MNSRKSSRLQAASRERLSAVGSKLPRTLKATPVGASLLATAVLALAGCSGLPATPVVPSATATTAVAPTVPAVPAVPTTALVLHDGDSRLELRLDRAGALARLGHRHVIVTQAVHGTADFDFAHPERAQFFAAFRVDTLQVDDAEARTAAGAGFDTVLDAAAIAGTREHMLSAVLLDAEHFPEISLRLRQLVPASDLPADEGVGGALRSHYLATVVFTVKGTDHALPVKVAVEAGAPETGGALTASGTWTVTHADLGLEPYSAAGGLLKVADAIEVRFKLVAKRP